AGAPGSACRSFSLPPARTAATSKLRRGRTAASPSGCDCPRRLVEKAPNRSGRRAQARQGDRDEPADRRLRGQAAGRGEGGEAVAREVVRGDVTPDGAGFGGPRQQASDELLQAPPRPGDVLVTMQERRHLAGAALVLDERVGPEHRLEALGRVATLVAERGELFEVLCHVP